MEDCDFGKILKSECHKITYSRKKFIEEFSKIKTDEQDLLLWRSGLRSHHDELITICNHHMQKYGPVFERIQDKCCNIFNIHNKKKVKGDRMISLNTAKQLELKGFRVTPGFKFCYNCSVKSSNINTNIPELVDEEVNIDVDVEFQMEKLDSSLINLGESPVRLHSLSSHRRIPTAKCKLDKAAKKLEEKVASGYGIDVSDLQKDQLINTEIEKEAADLDRLTLLMKEKIKTSSFNEIVQILTMTPESWSREYAAKYFEVSEHLIRKARLLKSEKGVFSLPTNKIGKKLSKWLSWWKISIRMMSILG